MIDVDDMLDDGYDFDGIWQALNECERALKAMPDTPEKRAVLSSVRYGLDRIELREAMGEFD